MQFPNSLLKFRMTKKQKKKNWVTGHFRAKLATFYTTVASMQTNVEFSPALPFPDENFKYMSAFRHAQDL